ncbi:MAG: hypothetical protein NTY05_03970 [Rhodocyclales bacterium]|nr:hypothetical protein [Rhodocyclales bacterium]
MGNDDRTLKPDAEHGIHCSTAARGRQSAKMRPKEDEKSCQLSEMLIALFSMASSPERTSTNASLSALRAISGATLSNNCRVAILPPKYPTIPLKEPAINPAVASTTGATGPNSTADAVT